jgi:hypothetical protein
LAADPPKTFITGTSPDGRRRIHGPEHWIGLLRAWVVIGLFVLGIWTLLEAIRTRIVAAVRNGFESR